MKAATCVKCGKTFIGVYDPALRSPHSVCDDCTHANVQTWYKNQAELQTWYETRPTEIAEWSQVSPTKISESIRLSEFEVVFAVFLFLSLIGLFSALIK